MTDIKAIVFDLGNVLIPFDYNIIINKLDLIEEGLGKRFYNLYQINYHLHRAYEKSAITTEEFLSNMLNFTEHKIDSETFCKIYSEIFTINEALTRLLPVFKQNYKLILLSNTNYIHQQYGYKHYKFFEHFDKLFLSHEVKAVKPEPEIYKAVMSYTNLKPNEHLFIDDVQEYIDGAKNMGWNAIRFVSNFRLEKELANYNIKF
jgi:putative hydrolase of the HAD superfamily